MNVSGSMLNICCGLVGRLGVGLAARVAPSGGYGDGCVGGKSINE